MRIHLVSRDVTSNHILARLAAVLVAHPAFTTGPQPDHQADVNYFFPYLEYPAQPYTATKTAAWFTHLDKGRAAKVSRWQSVASTVDLRLATARQYVRLLAEFGPAERVLAPLDRAKFALERPTARDSMRIGTSGYVYPHGRKGEALWEKLTQDGELLSRGVTFTAIGAGWPNTATKEISWDRVPEWYGTLRLYICTSLIEGVGYGPLEAMACGVPVVIPQGVGVFDDLPALENVHRYRAGDYADLRRSVLEALDTIAAGGYNPASLRGGTVEFTRDNWIDTHLHAFEDLLYGQPPVGELPAWHGRAAAYYVAFGPPARECATRAIRSFKEHMPNGVDVILAAASPLNAGEDVFVQMDDLDIGGRAVKTMVDQIVPDEYDYILYMDADTWLVAPVPYLFDALANGWELIFCTNPDKYATAGMMRRPDNGPECDVTFEIMGGEELLQLNGGVFAYRRNERMRAFMRGWHTEWQQYGARDQAALDRVLYKNPPRLLVLGNEWNTITRYIPAERSAGILHSPLAARRWSGLIVNRQGKPARLDSKAAWAAVAKFDGKVE